jgi:hypothetical protein
MEMVPRQPDPLDDVTLHAQAEAAWHKVVEAEEQRFVNTGMAVAAIILAFSAPFFADLAVSGVSTPVRILVASLVFLLVFPIGAGTASGLARKRNYRRVLLERRKGLNIARINAGMEPLGSDDLGKSVDTLEVERAQLHRKNERLSRDFGVWIQYGALTGAILLFALFTGAVYL